jgi:hypothetical protein
MMQAQWATTSRHRCWAPPAGRPSGRSRPNIKWGPDYGVIFATPAPQFGAVSVVSTNTLPLHVEILYNEYQSVGIRRRCRPFWRWSRY